MAKWGDYRISAVRYNREHKHIIIVKRLCRQGRGIGKFLRSCVYNCRFSYRIEKEISLPSIRE